MTLLARFRGAGLGATTLAVVASVWMWGERDARHAPELAANNLQVPIFRFEKSDLIGFDIVQPTGAIAIRAVEGVWRVEGQDWRPSSTMIRKVAHQLHDLTARATVVDAPEDDAVYGLGDTAITVTLHLNDGQRLRFQAGDPNPTSVSWYIRPLPGDRVFIVKKSAVDDFRRDIASFRETRIAEFDPRQVDMIRVELPERSLAFQRDGEHTWSQTLPVQQDASRDQVQRMLGRILALRADAFVEDHPTDLDRYGLGSPAARVTVTLDVGQTITVVVGAAVPETDPPGRYVLRVEDDAVYRVRDGILDPFREPMETYRNPVLLGKHAWDVTALTSTRGDEALRITRTSDGWRWPDGQAIAGSTPERVAGRAADIRAIAFRDDPPLASGLAMPWGTVALTFTDGTHRVLSLGPALVHAEDHGGGGATEGRRLLVIEGDSSVYEVDGTLATVMEDLHREYKRKRDREADRRADSSP